jgi:hypothetical protein
MQYRYVCTSVEESILRANSFTEYQRNILGELMSILIDYNRGVALKLLFSLPTSDSLSDDELSSLFYDKDRELEFTSVISVLKSKLSDDELNQLFYVLEQDVSYKCMKHILPEGLDINYLFALFLLDSNDKLIDKHKLCYDIITAKDT